MNVSSIDRSEGDFVRQFFTSSNVSQSEQSSQKIADMLCQLHRSGYEIDTSMRSFGPKGESWPPLVQNREITLISGQAIGTPGSNGRGSNTLEQYLCTLSQSPQVSVAHAISSCVMSSSADAPERISPSSAKMPLRSQSSVSSSSYSQDFSWPGVVGGPKMSITAPLSQDPKTSVTQLRQYAFFQQDPPSQRGNSLGPKDFENGDIFIIDDTRIVLVNSKQVVLAASNGVTILPQSFMPGMYEHRRGQFMDQPFSGHFYFRGQQLPLEAIIELLPYFNSIPKYGS